MIFFTSKCHFEDGRCQLVDFGLNFQTNKEWTRSAASLEGGPSSLAKLVNTTSITSLW